MKKKIISLILASIFLLPLLSSCALSNADYIEYVDYIEENCVQWSLSEDGKELSNGERVYKYLGDDYKIDPMYAYQFYNAVELETYYAYVEAPGKEKDSEIVWVCDEYEDGYMVFATEKGAAALKEFENGKYYSAIIMSPEYSWSGIDLSLLKELDGASTQADNKLKEDVTALKDIERFEIRVYDSTESFYKTYGAIYHIEDSWYYVNYDSLSNEHFDADGNFSYRRGSVELSKLSESVARKIKSAKNRLNVLYTAYLYERDEHITYEEYGEEDTSLGIVVFWVVYVLVCLVLPAAFAVFGCILARIEKLGRPKYWYILSLIALIWIVLSVVLMIILLI